MRRREKYWFPQMNSMIDTAIDQWYECQVAMRGDSQRRTNQGDQHPKPPLGNSIHGPWWTIPRWTLQSCPDWQKNQISSGRVCTINQNPDQRGEIEAHLCHIIMELWELKATAYPASIVEFNEFAKQEGFPHHRVMAFHPRVNGEVEKFTQTLNMTGQIANLQSKNHLQEKCGSRQAYRQRINTAPSYRSCTLWSPEKTPMRMKLDYIEAKPQRMASQTAEMQNTSRKWSNRERGQRPERTICYWEIMCLSNNQGRTSEVHPMNLCSKSCAAFMHVPT